ncbi:MAG: YceD family protein [Jatrophihabitantaceae bacterium]
MPENSTPTPRRATGPDPRSPYVFDVRPLGRRPGSMREDRRRAVAPAELGSELIGVPAGASLAVDVRLESVTEGVLVTGTVTTPIGGECARCLDPITDELVVDIMELFAYPDSVTDETSGTDEVHRIDGDLLDIEPVVHDAVVLGLPWTPLCRPDCAGLCPTCGERLDDLPDGHAHDTLDPRWAALRALVDGDSSTSSTTNGITQVSQTKE